MNIAGFLFFISALFWLGYRLGKTDGYFEGFNEGWEEAIDSLSECERIHQVESALDQIEGKNEEP